ncbi:MAG: D-alanine--D-alanine ligase [Anaerolineaceae bacterium]|nr:D-alanine--D-alanine ligase [Anaerolineaceae bacterium]
MENKTKLGLIFGGRSEEYEVSLMSARSILNAISPDKYQIFQIGITRQGQWLSGENVLDCFENKQFDNLFKVSILPEPGNHAVYKVSTQDPGMYLENIAELDIIFPILHGPYGEDGKFQSLFEIMEIPYVGAGVLSSAVSMDKGMFKDIMIAHNIPVADSILVTKSEIKTNLEAILDKIVNKLDYPIFIKPANMGSSVGVSKCIDKNGLINGLHEAAKFDQRILIEQGINAQEIEISLTGNETIECSNPGEICFQDDFYSYDAKYADEKSYDIIPAEIPSETQQEILEIAKKAYRAVDCAGLARVDFLVERNTNKVILSEINTLPGFTQISMFPKLLLYDGMEYSEIIDHLIALAFEKHQ